MATFNGTEGNDTIIGGADNDVINGNGGNDSLLGGDGSDTVSGGAGNDFLSGNAGTDWVEGGTGNDEVRGGSGQDSVAFHEFGAANADILPDFDAGWDNIQLDAAAFTQIGAAGRMAAGDARFFAGTAAHDADDRIIYDGATGQLWYDADGNGTGAAQLIATISNHSALSATDLWVFGSAPTGQTINGTAGDDMLVGGPGNDTIDGLAGNDTVIGNGGDDSLVGGPGADSMIGGDGNDTLDGLNRPTNGSSTGYTDVDVDTMDGGLGNDTYYVDNPADVLIDAGGIDTVITRNTSWTLGPGFENLIVRVDDEGNHGTGNELDNVLDATGAFKATLNGMGGNDLLLGSVGKDTLLGGDGNDTIMGGERDSMDGGAGDDVLSAGPFSPSASAAVLTGGAGADSFVFGGAPGTNTDPTWITDFTSGADKIHLDANVMPALGTTGNFSAGDPRFYAAAGATGGHDADDRVVYDTSTGNLYYDADGSGAGAALLIAQLHPELSATPPATLVASDIAVDNGTTPVPPGSIVGTEGNDSLFGTSGNDTIYGLGGNDFIAGNGGADSIVGGAGNDSIFGNDGNDWLEGTTGNDTLSGGSGMDSYVFRESGTANADLITNFGSGWDNVQLDAAGFSAIGASGRFASGDVRFFAGAGATGGHDADDRIVYNTSTGQLFYDADGSGTGASQLIATFQGAPSMAATDITVFGTATPPPPGTINGTSGNDSLVGTAAPETLNGFGGDDSLVGGGGGDVYNGGDGNDTMYGWNARFGDTDAHADTMDGGTGNDRFYVDNAGDVLTDAGGIDTVVAKNIDWTLGAGFENLVMNNGEVESMRTGIGNELDNVLDGRSTQVMTTGGDGWYVHLEGLGGNDTLYGSVKDDLLVGGDGNDVLAGGQGVDMMTGGTGADRFALDSIGSSTVTDFAGGTDKIRLDGNQFANVGSSGNFAPGDERFYAAAGATSGHDATDRLVYDTTTGNLYYDADGSGSGAAQGIGTLQGAPALTATDVEVLNGTTPTPTPGTTLNGTSGNDTLIGTTGNDTIWGNSGNDWIEGRGGNDQLSGGSGQDSYVFREFGAANADTLLNFDSNWDAMRFDSSAFAALGGPGHFAAGDARFFAGAGASSGHDADDRIVYNTSTGQLYYDADGAGGADAQLVATVQGATPVAAQDIWVI